VDELHAAIAAFLRAQRTRPTVASPVGPRGSAIYARVAVPTDREAGSLQWQVEACRAYALARGEPVRFTFAETADGLTLDRPQLRMLRDAIARGWIAAVLVTSTARLTPAPRLLRVLADEWEAAGVAIVVVGGM
jgi:DNA invertase Pin-like site-specific DNA recombinase